MIKVDLITGFLGSGKTTFIRKYARYLMDQGMHIGILENDFGAVNVDMMLLQDIMGDQCEVEMIAGGCDRDCHRRRFKTKLIAMGMCGYDRVIVEPSGIYDVDEFFDVLREEPLDQWYEIGSVIAIVDAGLEDSLSRQADYLLASECANAGRILLSRTEETSSEKRERTIRHLHQALQQIQCFRRFQEEIVNKKWDEFTEDDFRELMSSGYVTADYEKMDVEEKDIFSSICFMDVHMEIEQLRKTVEKIFENEEGGKVYRVKGFLKTEKEGWLQLNAAPEQIKIQPAEAGQEVLIAIGEGLVQEKLQNIIEKKGQYC